MKILLSPYNPEWPSFFENEKRLLADALAEVNPVIEHVGSTSVPGLTAKPTIDIQLGLSDFQLADEQVPKILALGYTHIDLWDNEIPNRRLFTKEINGLRTHNIHMVGLDSDWWVRHLQFRDYLRKNEKIRKAYAQLKKELSEQDWAEVNEYAEAKTAFIRKAEAQAKTHL